MSNRWTADVESDLIAGLEEIDRLEKENDRLTEEVRKHKRQCNELRNKNLKLKRQLGELDKGGE